MCPRCTDNALKVGPPLGVVGEPISDVEFRNEGRRAPGEIGSDGFMEPCEAALEPADDLETCLLKLSTGVLSPVIGPVASLPWLGEI